ncbi:MAG: hypothetical protein LBG59_09130 [Candidatus Peribacteria bacterium]|nr:hypothetical protein [Candidatus Peribacteria bacterium]
MYRLGTYERLEITNLSDTDFVGSLTLNGVKSSAFKLNNITIPAYASLLIADDKINGILNTEIIISSNAGLNFTDAEPINIELLVDGILLDTFNVDSTTVGANKNKIPRPSFSKLYDHGERKIEASSTDHNFNIEGFTANPGKFTII